MADQKKFEDEAGKTITEKDVEDFYEENKEVRFRRHPRSSTVPRAAYRFSDKKVN